MKTKLIFLAFVFSMITFVSFGQTDVEMADVMRSNGKIYVVVAVAGIVMAGLIIYLVSLDRKITSLEKKIKK